MLPASIAQLFLVACNSLLTFCITELCYMLAGISQLSLVVLHYSCKLWYMPTSIAQLSLVAYNSLLTFCIVELCYMLASIAQLSLVVLRFSSNFLYHRTLLHDCQYCSTFLGDLAILFWLYITELCYMLASIAQLFGEKTG